MKKYLIGGLITIVVLGLFSYTSTDGGHTDKFMNGNQRIIYNIPLKQKRVVTTEDIKYVNQLVQKGYVVQFVTERQWGTADSHARYTLIKY